MADNLGWAVTAEVNEKGCVVGAGVVDYVAVDVGVCVRREGLQGVRILGVDEVEYGGSRSEVVVAYHCPRRAVLQLGTCRTGTEWSVVVVLVRDPVNLAVAVVFEVGARHTIVVEVVAFDRQVACHQG